MRAFCFSCMSENLFLTPKPHIISFSKIKIMYREPFKVLKRNFARAIFVLMLWVFVQTNGILLDADVAPFSDNLV